MGGTAGGAVAERLGEDRVLSSTLQTLAAAAPDGVSAAARTGAAQRDSGQSVGQGGRMRSWDRIAADGKAPITGITGQDGGYLTALPLSGTGTDGTVRQLAELIAGMAGFRGRVVFGASPPDGTPRKLLPATMARDERVRQTYRWFVENVAGGDGTRLHAGWR